MSSDAFSELHPNVISAAQAAVAWARERRATWTDAPLPDIPFLPEPRTRPDEFGPDSLKAWTSEPAPPPPASEPQGPSAAARATEWARSAAESAQEAGASLARWAIRGAVAAVLLVAAVIGGKYAWSAARQIQIPKVTTARTERRQPTPKPALGSGKGGLEVNSSPDGAQVIVDGKARGVTPIALTDIAPGRHTVVLKSSAGTVGRTVTVVAGETATIDESIFSGFAAIYSPFELSITEDGRALHADERNQIMLPPGRHELRLVNRPLAYDVVRQVDVKPGETTRVSITAPRSTITVTSADVSEVWIDGSRVADTPMYALPIDIGTHEVVVKRAGAADRRFTVTVTVNPFTLDADR
jgi:hypothetical protein